MIAGEKMFGAFGNQEYNAPTMKSFGGIYASDVYSTFHAPTTVFRSGKGETGELITKTGLKLIGKGGKFTDDGVGVILRGFSPADMRVFGKKGLKNAGAGNIPLEDLGDEALTGAIKGALKNQGRNGLKDIMKALKTSGNAGTKVADQIFTNLKNAGVNKNVLGGEGLLGKIIDDAAFFGRPLSETPVAGTGKVLDDVIETSTTQELKITLRGADGAGGVLNGMKPATRGIGGKTAIGGLLVLSAVAPVAAGKILGFAFTNLGETLSIAMGDDDSGDGGLSVPECPTVGEACDESTTLSAGCVCNDSNGDGEGVIEQQGFKLNYGGYMVLGGIALAGVVLLGTIIR
jgi:hypothetical protein